MSKTAVVLDTNVIILHITGKNPVDFSNYNVLISALTVFELLQYSKLTAREEGAIYDIIADCMVIPISQNIAEQAAKLARKKKIGTVDALIAATAMVFQVPLSTKNVKDFRHIPGLQLV